MRLSLDSQLAKSTVFTEVQKYLAAIGLPIIAVDADRPWGGFYVIDESHLDNFIKEYFPELARGQIERGARLSPKILIVAPGARLSWQYHYRREELWKNISGAVGYITSPTDDQGQLQTLATDETVQFAAKIRHRLVGLESWGVIAEIWQHTDPAKPSDESDIVRVADDFGR